MPFPPDGSYSTLVDVLADRAGRTPNGIAFRFYGDEALGGGVERITYAELHDSACRVALALRALGPCRANPPGAGIAPRAIVLLPPGFGYIGAYMGALYAGWIPVPTFPPDGPVPSKTLARLASILADAAPSAVLATRALCADLAQLLAPLSAGHDPLRGARCVALEDTLGLDGGEWRRPDVDANDLALLQYTSGSVGDPKGTMVSHGNLLANLELIARCEAATPEKRGVCWLPPYHDMGLIGGILNPLHAGYPMALMPPFRFLKRPARWLQAISEHRAHITVAPNFAFEFAARRVKESDKEGLDLSSLETVFNGAEPIRASALDAFVEAFGPCGFRREAFLPCYGLAEGTLIVAGQRRGLAPTLRRASRAALLEGRLRAPAEVRPEGPPEPDEVRLVGCGPALAPGIAAIVDPETCELLPDGTVGEIWLQSPSVAKGYWNRPEETAETFGALLANGRGPFLRTGDTGCFTEGELYVVGRLKDLILVDGQNLYPADLEETVEGVQVAPKTPALGGVSGPQHVPGVLRPISAGSAAAVAVATPEGERPLILAEVERRALEQIDLEQLARSIRRRVTRMHRVETAGVVLLRRPALPKTPNGKLQRRACREAFLAGRFEPLEAVFFREVLGATAQGSRGADRRGSSVA